ncbi:hypothetical protein CPT_Stills63 [Bacillus phage Stills]|uniref:Uncharacterized protein n=1 Tax=Bacillus phage Stills TaxID=1610833 RepID=A0A0E3T5L0_9CAUD|nr:hypothetical protein CPT_Stills63 [Bacillus phage Stills]AKC02691.1 hypothetical protein CPT_Stills63 [Bacillus phage Stills]
MGELNFNDFAVGDVIRYVELEEKKLFRCTITAVSSDRISFEIHTRYDLETNSFMREFEPPLKHSVNSFTLYRIDFWDQRKGRRDSNLDEFGAEGLRRMFIDLAMDTKDDVWLENLKGAGWIKELSRA